MKDVLIGLLVVSVVVAIVAVVFITMMSTPDRVCNEWVVIPKQWPW